MKKRTIHIFNPEHDLALADGGRNYLPPHSAQKMADDLSVLPAWWAMDGDSVLVSSIAMAERCAEASHGLMPHVEWASMQVVPHFEDVNPWGWDASLCSRLKKWGISDNALPDDGILGRIRQLSNRRTAANLLPLLNVDSVFCGVSVVCDSRQAIQAEVEKYSKTILKSPWSGSGKGLRFGFGNYDEQLRNWSQAVLQKQGCVIVEPFYDKVCDFAMEFWSDGGNRIKFIGYSRFETNIQGAYLSNIVDSDERIETYLSKYTNIHWNNFIQRVMNGLSNCIGNEYKGYLGIDMMVCRFKNEPFLRIHPCVEVNLRMNMGIVSHILFERYIDPKNSGIFKIIFSNSNEKLCELLVNKANESPIAVKDGKIVQGFLPLTPIGKNTQYLAYLQVI